MARIYNEVILEQKKIIAFSCLLNSKNLFLKKNIVIMDKYEITPIIICQAIDKVISRNMFSETYNTRMLIEEMTYRLALEIIKLLMPDISSNYCGFCYTLDIIKDSIKENVITAFIKYRNISFEDLRREDVRMYMLKTDTYHPQNWILTIEDEGEERKTITFNDVIDARCDFMTALEIMKFDFNTREEMIELIFSRISAIIAHNKKITAKNYITFLQKELINIYKNH